MICEGCVFHKKIAERGQEACGRCDDKVEAIKACINADMCKRCEDRMTRGDVASLAREVEELKKEKKRAADLLGVVWALISEILKEGDDDAEKL